MKKSILSMSLILITTALSPTFAMFHEDEDGNNPSKKINLKGNHTLNHEDIQSINNTGGSVSVHSEGDLKISSDSKILTNGTLSITCTGSFINTGEIQGHHIILTGSSIINRGRIISQNFSPD